MKSELLFEDEQTSGWSDEHRPVKRAESHLRETLISPERFGLTMRSRAV